MRNFINGQITLLDPQRPIQEQTEMLPYDTKWEFPKEQLQLSKFILKLLLVCKFLFFHSLYILIE